ncbi:MAG: hypothetical protein QXZ17_10145 [Nitrososphaerota archaeon]
MIKRGVAYTAIEIILKAASNADGKIATRDLIINVKGSKMVKDTGLLSEHVRGKIGKDRYDPTVGVHVVEKTLSQLKTKGILESDTISDGKFKFRGYKLKCANLFDLAGIYLFILEGERHWTNDPYDYPRLIEFLKSPFFYRAIKEYIFDLIYYFNLWDMEKYPISKRCWEGLLAEEGKSAKIGVQNYLLFYTPFTGPGFPNFYRENFPNEGPAKYESFLRSIQFDKWFLLNLGLAGYDDPEFTLEMDVVDQTANLFKFVRNPLTVDIETQKPLKTLLEMWFTHKWYGELDFHVTRLQGAGTILSEIAGGKLKENACIPSLSTIMKDGYSLLNPFALQEILRKNGLEFPEFISQKYPVYVIDRNNMYYGAKFVSELARLNRLTRSK